MENISKSLDEFVCNLYKIGGKEVYKEIGNIDYNNTALVIIDVQNFVTKEALEAECKTYGIDPTTVKPLLDYYSNLIESTVNNIEKILVRFREKSGNVFHIKIESLVSSCKDVGHLHKRAGMLYPQNSNESEIIKILEPKENEFVLSKTCSGAYVGTSIDKILRNLNIKNLIVVGMYTDQCVSTSVRDFADLNYNVILVEDATCAMSEQRRRNALESLSNIYAYPINTKELLEFI